MGLDQYAQIKSRKTGEIISDDFYYWRKNRQLNGWMEQLYVAKCRKKGIEPVTFNCVPLDLEKEDIQKLMSDVLDDNLPDAHGFFWGDRDYDLDRRLGDLDFCHKALVILENDDNAVVVYHCWY